MKKKKKTKPSSSSLNPINGSDSSAFHVSIATTAVAQICHSLGFKSTQTTALQTLTNVTVRYLTSLATSAATSSASSNRTECNLYDVIRGMEDVHADVGFTGNSAVTRRLCSLSDSEMLKDLMRFVHWSREIPFAKPLHTVTSSYPMVNKNAVPRGKEMVTSLNGESNGNEKFRNYRGEKKAVNEGKSESEVVPRGKPMVTSLYVESNGNEAVNEGKMVPRGKQMLTSLCENERLIHYVSKKSYCGEEKVFTQGEKEEEKKRVPRGKQMLTSLYGESSEELVTRGKQMVTCHVPKWLPDFPNCGEKEVFTGEVNDGKKSESEKVNYNPKEVSELPEVRKKVRFEIRGLKSSKRVKDVIKVKCRGVDLRSGVCKGGKRILCQIYQDLDGKKYGDNYGVVKKKTKMIK